MLSSLGRLLVSAALAFARAGYTIFLIGRSVQKLKETKNLIEKKGEKAIVIPTEQFH